MTIKVQKTNALSKAVEKIKIKEPIALPFGEWRRWKEEQKKNRPIMYFCQLVVWQKIKDICDDVYRKFWQNPIYAIKYRTTHKYNVLDTGLKPSYYDLDTRILHGLFNELVNFVECEKAWMNIVWGKEPGKRGLFERFRSPELGVQYLQWEIDIEDDENNAPKIIDYLSVDVDPSTATLESLYAVFKTNYHFNLITFETDYGGDVECNFTRPSTRDPSREFLTNKGYVLITEIYDRVKTWFHVDDFWVHESILDKSFEIAPKVVIY